MQGTNVNKKTLEFILRHRTLQFISHRSVAVAVTFIL